MLLKSCAMGAALSAFAFTAAAAPAPYADAGVENAVEYTFTATETGDIVAYFAGKAGADYSDFLSMSVNGVATGVYGLRNQTSSYGQAFNLGKANAGDTVTFTLYVSYYDTDWSSNKSENSDGVNHVFSSAFESDESIPTGVYVAFEDLQGSEFSDFNYTDHQFVVTNITGTPNTPEVPLPASAWLLGSGLMGLAGVSRSRNRKA
jgi:hypothetical protein